MPLFIRGARQECIVVGAAKSRLTCHTRSTRARINNNNNHVCHWRVHCTRRHIGDERAQDTERDTRAFPARCHQPAKELFRFPIISPFPRREQRNDTSCVGITKQLRICVWRPIARSRRRRGAGPTQIDTEGNQPPSANHLMNEIRANDIKLIWLSRSQRAHDTRADGVGAHLSHLSPPVAAVSKSIYSNDLIESGNGAKA